MNINNIKDDKTVIKAPNTQSTTENSNSSSTRRGKNNKTNNVIYAGNLNMNNDNVTSKKLQANKQAMKSIMDQFKKDKKVDNDLEELNSKKADLEKESKMASDQINDLDVKKQELMKTYGVTEDSEEQKDLDLLEKSIFSPDSITDDEYKQLEKMGPLTDYQKESFKFTAMQKIFKDRVDNAANGIVGINMSVTSIKLSLLKSHPMVDAQKEAMQILDDAMKEVLGTLLDQGKETIDKTAEENKKKIEEGQKEQEEKDAESNPSQNTNSLSSSQQTDQLQLVDELKKFAAKQNMLEEDVKGIEVDKHA